MKQYSGLSAAFHSASRLFIAAQWRHRLGIPRDTAVTCAYCSQRAHGP